MRTRPGRCSGTTRSCTRPTAARPGWRATPTASRSRTSSVPAASSATSSRWRRMLRRARPSTDPFPPAGQPRAKRPSRPPRCPILVRARPGTGGPMARPLAALNLSRGRWFDLAVFALGVVLVAWSTFEVIRHGTPMSGLVLLSVPLIVIIAKFPMVLDSGDGGIEVGFDSSILMFLLCTLGLHEALVIWALGVLVTQITTDKRPMVKLFNVGIGVVGGAVSAWVIHGVRGPHGEGTARELLAVALAAAAYFATDFVLSAVSVALETETPLRGHLIQRGTLVAIACFVPFDSLGYLGAVVGQLQWWTLLLLAVPLAALLVASCTVAGSTENARRLSVLFQAAMRAQTLSDTRQVLDALTDDARRLLRIRQVEVRATPPGPHEVGAQLRDGQRDRWIVAPARHRARSTTTADQQALEAMVAVSSDLFTRPPPTE